MFSLFPSESKFQMSSFLDDGLVSSKDFFNLLHGKFYLLFRPDVLMEHVCEVHIFDLFLEFGHIQVHGFHGLGMGLEGEGRTPREGGERWGQMW